MESNCQPSFYIEHLNEKPEHLGMISVFKTRELGEGLSTYLKLFAGDDEEKGRAKTYIVRDVYTKEMVGYFSLKCGHVVEKVKVGCFRKERIAEPGIELANFAINENYRISHPKYEHLGKMIFVRFIEPMVKEVSKVVGVRYLYIFALPEPSLINYYKTLGFTRFPKNMEQYLYRHSKPNYDAGCIFMYRLV